MKQTPGRSEAKPTREVCLVIPVMVDEPSYKPSADLIDEIISAKMGEGASPKSIDKT